MPTECRTAEAWRLRCRASCPIASRLSKRSRPNSRCLGMVVDIPSRCRQLCFAVRPTNSRLTKAGSRRLRPDRLRMFPTGRPMWRNEPSAKQVRSTREFLRASVVSLIPTALRKRTWFSIRLRVRPYLAGRQTPGGMDRRAHDRRNQCDARDVGASLFSTRGNRSEARRVSPLSAIRAFVPGTDSKRHG